MRTRILLRNYSL